eukprot:3787035-Amphidinium_carterae.4
MSSSFVDVGLFDWLGELIVLQEQCARADGVKRCAEKHTIGLDGARLDVLEPQWESNVTDPDHPGLNISMAQMSIVSSLQGSLLAASLRIKSRTIH